MKAFLITLGLLLVTALTVALVGPSFIDWNGYRALIEAEAGRLAGRPVKIDGDLRVRALPQPRVRAGDVSIFASDDARAMVTAQSVDLHLDLGALVLGNIEISELSLTAPQLQVGPLLAGISSLGERERAPARPGILRHIEASNATLVFDNPFGAGTLTASDVDLQVTASTLTGPYKVTGNYGPGGEGVERPSFSASVGAIDHGGPVKVAGRIGLDVGDASFDGAIDNLALTPRYEGRLKIERQFASAGEGTGGRIAIEAAAELSSGLADLADIKLTAAEGEQALTFTGTGRVNFDGAPRFAADLKARQIDLDETLGKSENNALAHQIRDVASAVARYASENDLAGRLQLGVGGAIWREELARDISAAIEISTGTVSITNLRGSLPGETNVSFSGKVDLAAAPRLEGRLVAETFEAGRLVHWIAPERGAQLGDILGHSRGKYSINGTLSADEESLTLDAVDGFADGNPFSGSFAARLDREQPQLRADLAFDLVALDRYVPAETRPADLLSVFTGPPQAEPSDVELVIDARVKRLTWRGQEAKSVEIGLIAAEGGVDIAAFNIGRFAEATIAAEGHLRPSPAGPLGAVQVGLEAADLNRLMAVLGLEVPQFMGISPSLRDADILLSVDSELSEQGRMAVISISGEIAGASVEINTTSDAPLLEFGDGALKLAANIEASEAARIFGPGGLVPLAGQERAGGAGRVSITGEGRLSDSLELALLAEAFDGILKGEGQIAGGDQLRAKLFAGANRLGPVASAFGLEVPDIAARAPVRMDATLEGTSERLTLGIDDGVVAGARIAGSAEIGAGSPRKIELELDTSRISLPWIAANLFGDGSGARAGNGTTAALGAAWPTELIDTRVFNQVELSASGRADQLYLSPGVRLRDGEFALAISNGALKLTRLEGHFGDGTLAISGTAGVEDQVVQIEGQVEMRNVPLERIVIDGRGRGLAGGLADFESEFSASGRSLLSLVASLEGNGTFAINDPEVTRLDAAALFDLAAVAQETSAFEAALIAGRSTSSSFNRVSGRFAAANGRLKFGPAKLAADRFDGEVTSFFDVPSRRIDQELTLRQKDGSGPQLAVVHAGLPGEVGREVEFTDVPQLGSVRWREPLDNFALPPPERADEWIVIEPMNLGDDNPAGEDANTAPVAEPPPDPELPPVGLIDQQIIDLPILKQPPQPAIDDGAG